MSSVPLCPRRVQVPQPFPRPGTGQPAQPARPAPPPTTPRHPPAPPPRRPAPEAAADRSHARRADFPGAQFIASYDAGRGQRYYIFGSPATFVDLVAYYRTVLKQKGELGLRRAGHPRVRRRQVSRRDDGVSAGRDDQDFQSDISQGYPNPKPGGQPARFPTGDSDRAWSTERCNCARASSAYDLAGHHAEIERTDDAGNPQVDASKPPASSAFERYRCPRPTHRDPVSSIVVAASRSSSRSSTFTGVPFGPRNTARSGTVIALVFDGAKNVARPVVQPEERARRILLPASQPRCDAAHPRRVVQIGEQADRHQRRRRSEPVSARVIGTAETDPGIAPTSCWPRAGRRSSTGSSARPTAATSRRRGGRKQRHRPCDG